MKIEVKISDLSGEEHQGLQFAMDRFNGANRTSYEDFDSFLAAFIEERLIPRFLSDEHRTFKQRVQQQLRKVTITSNEVRKAFESAIQPLLPAENSNERTETRINR